MRLECKVETEVLVVGAGLAGIMAAVSAAEAGARVCIMSSSEICSGSSFYKGTWGLGLIGPENAADEQDLADTIMRVGEGMAIPELVETFSGRIREGIACLESMGVRLKEAENKAEKEFIPCFDHKIREWHGFVKESAREALLKRLRVLGVRELPFMELLECTTAGERTNGVVALGRKEGLTALSCRSLVIATGGLGGLFRYRLNTAEATTMGHYAALKAGAELVNLEFMQIMPGYIKPAPKTIYNEKVFQFSDFWCPGTGAPVFGDWESEELKRRMAVRSTHGPFTSRLISREVDLRLFSQFLKDPRGIDVTYKKELRENQPEFIRTYFEWLKREKHLTIDDKIRLGIFAHASNGGIRIDREGWTGVPGLFACGEASGGMHGADRIGGLSTANALVFGRIAGKSAAESSRNRRERAAENAANFLPEVIPEAESLLSEIQAINFRHAMVVRSEAGTEQALADLESIKARIGGTIKEGGKIETEAVRSTYELKAAVLVSECLLNAIRMRAESRGPHYRSDYPKVDKSIARPIASVYNDKVKTCFIKSII